MWSVFSSFPEQSLINVRAVWIQGLTSHTLCLAIAREQVSSWVMQKWQQCPYTLVRGLPCPPSSSCVHACLLSHWVVLCDPMNCSPPGSSVYGLSQARIWKCVAISSSRRGRFLTTRETLFSFTVQHLADKYLDFPKNDVCLPRSCLVPINMHGIHQNYTVKALS